MPHNNNMRRSGSDNDNENRQGREGRGRENKRNSRNNASKNNDNDDKKKERKVLADHIFHLETLKQADDCEIISEYLINHIKKTYFNEDDIENALNQLRKIDFKKLMSIKEEVDVNEDEKDEDKIAASNASAKTYDLTFTAEITNFVKRKAAHQFNKEKAHAFLCD